MSAGHGGARRARWLLTPLAVIAGCLALAPGAAQAGQGNSTLPTFPITAQVGDADLDASIEIVNRSSPPQDGGPSTICNFGDAGLCAGDEGITLIPSCGENDGAASCTAPDPGVFEVTSTPVGAAGCAGTLFAVTVADAALGKLRFTPQNRISLAPGATCKIDFKIRVLKVPTLDSDPGRPGVQTSQLASSRFVSTLFPARGNGNGETFGTTVNPPPPPPPPPATVNPPPPSATVNPPPPPEGPSGGRLPISARPGTARIVGKSGRGCVTRNFNVTVTGRRIRRVTFFLDGRRIRVLRRPNAGRTFRIRVRPGRLRRGTHRIVAVTTFTAASRTPSRRLRVVFQRCARRASTPRFTG